MFCHHRLIGTIDDGVIIYLHLHAFLSVTRRKGRSFQEVPLPNLGCSLEGFTSVPVFAFLQKIVSVARYGILLHSCSLRSFSRR